MSYILVLRRETRTENYRRIDVQTQGLPWSIARKLKDLEIP